MATKTDPKVVEESPIDILEPEIVEQEVVIGEGNDKLVFTQKPLSFLGKIEFFSVLGKAIEKALSDGASISEIIEVPDSMDVNSVKEADVFVKSITKVVQIAPETLGDILCVILRVPRGEREYVKLRLEDDLYDDQAFEIFNTFVDQNWEIMTSFFTEKGMPLFQKISQKLQK